MREVNPRPCAVMAGHLDGITFIDSKVHGAVSCLQCFESFVDVDSSVVAVLRQHVAVALTLVALSISLPNYGFTFTSDGGSISHSWL